MTDGALYQEHALRCGGVMEPGAFSLFLRHLVSIAAAVIKESGKAVGDDDERRRKHDKSMEVALEASNAPGRIG